jgi:hypothetical protein
MSLAKYYNDNFGSEKVAGEAVNYETEKTAAEVDADAVQSIVGQLSDEDCEKLAAACDLFDEQDIEFDSGVEKIAAAAELCDAADEEVSADEDAEKVAAEYVAAGRIIAQGFMDEISQ